MEALHRSAQVAARDDGVATFVNARPRMFAAALRTLGNAAEAEDVVQDTWLRWQNVHRDVVRDAPAFLTTTTRRLAINRALGARNRHETALEPWLVEAVDPDAGPGMLAERGQALESAFLLVLAKLSPMERAAYLLREAFNYSYQHIARVVRVSEAHSRQLVTRARKHLVEGPRVAVASAELRRVTVAFVEAAQEGDLAGLEAVLSADILESLENRRTARECRPSGSRASRRPSPAPVL
jgi:RNA polymerase sigma factor (sigma-70 family)